MGRVGGGSASMIDVCWYSVREFMLAGDCVSAVW